jgi:hypothetical protein
MSLPQNIVILTGAGVSAESGIDTFRGGGGLWEQHRVEDVATPEAFARDPDLVLRFYDMRRAAIQEKAPNAAHRALARLEREWPIKVRAAASRWSPRMSMTCICAPAPSACSPCMASTCPPGAPPATRATPGPAR